MYIARKDRDGRYEYFICETYNDNGVLKERILFELGHDPGRYIVYPGGNSFYIDETVELTILQRGFKVDTFELERLFWPYVDPRLRRVLRNPSRRVSRRRYSREELFRMQADIHVFDKRRLHFLRFGTINQSDIGRYPYRFFNKLLNKSRDEIECMIDEAERKLRSTELKLYVYTIFNLSSYFPSTRQALTNPAELPEDRVDEAFLSELCRVNEDVTLWGSNTDRGKLNNYLKKYVIMYFDNAFPRPRGFTGFRFREVFRPAASGPAMMDALRAMGLTEAQFRDMTLKELQRRYRHLAQQCHPDRGGCKEEFIRLTEAYDRLVAMKKEMHREV